MSRDNYYNYYRGGEFGEESEGPIAGWEEKEYDPPKCDNCGCVFCICNNPDEANPRVSQRAGQPSSPQPRHVGYIRCKFCGVKGLHWHNEGAWVLRQPDRTKHVCGKIDLTP